MGGGGGGRDQREEGPPPPARGWRHVGGRHPEGARTSLRLFGARPPPFPPKGASPRTARAAWGGGGAPAWWRERRGRELPRGLPVRDRRRLDPLPAAPASLRPLVAPGASSRSRLTRRAGGTPKAALPAPRREPPRPRSPSSLHASPTKSEPHLFQRRSAPTQPRRDAAPLPFRPGSPRRGLEGDHRRDERGLAASSSTCRELPRGGSRRRGKVTHNAPCRGPWACP